MVAWMTPGAVENPADLGFRTVRMADKPRLVRAIFDDVATRYDLMNDLMSAGVHRLWKSAMIDWLAPRTPARFLDVAGGTGDVAFRILNRLSATGPNATDDVTVTLLDASEAMLETGRDRAIDAGILQGLHWVRGDAENLPIEDGSVDYYTIAFGIRNVARVERIAFNSPELAPDHTVQRRCVAFNVDAFDEDTWSTAQDVFNIQCERTIISGHTRFNTQEMDPFTNCQSLHTSNVGFDDRRLIYDV